jgi:hypothetical protein
MESDPAVPKHLRPHFSALNFDHFRMALAMPAPVTAPATAIVPALKG